MAGSPTNSVKRAANAERDIATSFASDSTVHGRAGSRWTRAMAWPICGRMIESNHAADDRRRRTSSTVAQDLVPVAHLFARQIEKLRATNARLARQPVAGTVRHEREVARLKDVIRGPLHIQDAPPR